MQKNETITPEIILQKYSKRLKKKKDELEYLVCMNRQFEKWQLLLHIKPEINDVPVLHFVCLPFKPQEAFFSRSVHTAG